MEKAKINDLTYNADRILILGTTGQGKSTCASRIIHLHPADLVLIYDWQQGEFARLLGAPLCHTREEVAERIEQGQHIVCYDPEIPVDDDYDDNQAEDFAWWCTMVMEVSGELDCEKLVVIDEAQDLMTAHKIPAPLRWLLARGRRRRIDTILLAESANAIHGKGRNQVSQLYCFQCTDDNATDYPVSLGLDRDEIKNLAPTHFIHWNKYPQKISRLALWENKE